MMQNVKTSSLPVLQSRQGKTIFYAIILLLLIGAAGLLLYTSSSAQPAPARTAISQAVLAEKYGLRVSLVAVTAAGGMVDLRLKILDGEKAKLLLQDKQNFPTLDVGGGVILAASEDSIAQQIKFENDASLFLIYSNAGNAVKRGTGVSVVFGSTILESLPAK